MRSGRKAIRALRRGALLGIAALVLGVPVASAVVIEEFPAAGGPFGITSGPGGNLWFTESIDDRVSRMSTGGAVVGSTVVDEFSGIGELVTGPDGNVWFVQTDDDQVGRITPAGVRLPDIALPGAANDPLDLAVGSDGNVWVAATGNIFRITPAGAVTGFPVPGDRFTQSIAAGPDGNLWFTEPDDDRIGRITVGGAVTEFLLPNPDSAPLDIAAGSDGALWFTENGGNRIGRISTAGAISEFPFLVDPTLDRGPEGIAAGPDGNLWFTATAVDRIGRITPSGAITEFPVPTPASEPSRITAGPDGRMWFTELGVDRIGRVTLDPPGVTTGPATGITTTAATLTGSVDPNAAATSYRFEYGTTTAYGSSTAVVGAGSGDDPVSVSERVSGLRPGTTYHFRLVATSPIGTTFGADVTLTAGVQPPPPPPPPAPPAAPAAGPPIVTTGRLRDLRATRVSMTGTVNPNGLATQYGAECVRGSRTRRTPLRDLAAGTTPLQVRVPVTGLRPRTTYTCRLVAVNSAGTTLGADRRFTTHARLRLLFPDRVTVPADQPFGVRYRSTLAARIVARVGRRAGAAAAQAVRGRARRGVNRLRLPALTAGRYLLTVRARAEDGQRTTERIAIVAVAAPGACPPAGQARAAAAC
jgi:streptogramin lyase